MPKKVFYLLCLLLLTHCNTTAQLLSGKSPCLPFTEKGVTIYIPGYTDSSLANGRSGRVISASRIHNGFRLVSGDTAVKILDFLLVFADNYNTIYSIPSRGDEIKLEYLTYQQLTKIRQTTMLSVQQIRLTYRGQCYVAPEQFYLVR